RGAGRPAQHLTRKKKPLSLTDYKRPGGSGRKGGRVKLQPGKRLPVNPTVVLRPAFEPTHKYTGPEKCGAKPAILGINPADGGK
ncbi:hypothetical protein CWI58_11755, partial [Neisseria meningitidis]|uniref:hypothetical protein n=1 Tax=Neisseria meningitidis TaxID=487 RepID=UPI000CA707C0